MLSREMISSNICRNVRGPLTFDEILYDTVHMVAFD